jgi:hypothetical protein
LLYREAPFQSRKPIDMFEIKVNFISKNETLFGLMLDQGEYEMKKEKWVPFTRLRLGFIFITLDLAWYSK